MTDTDLTAQGQNGVTNANGEFKPRRLTPPSDFLTQDEHPQLEIPFSVKIGDRRLGGRSLSLTHAVAEGLLPPALNGAVEPATIRFDFHGFSVQLFADVAIHKEGDAGDPSVILRFNDPTGSHLAPLRYVLNSYLAGDMVSMGGLLGYTGPVQVKSKAKAAPDPFSVRLGRFARRSAVVAASVALIAVAGGGIYERLTLGYEPRPVTIGPSGSTLRATAAGQITYVDRNASAGDVIYSISANSGDFLSVKMPCDCTVDALPDFFEGATVMTGTPLVTLVDPSAPLTAQTELTFEGVATFLEGAQPELVFSDGTVLPVGLELMQAADTTVRSEETVRAMVELPASLPPVAAANATAQLRMNTPLIPEPWTQAARRALARGAALFDDS